MSSTTTTTTTTTMTTGTADSTATTTTTTTTTTMTTGTADSTATTTTTTSTKTTTGTTDKPVLTYFAGPGRAELARLCFHAGGVAFEDKRVDQVGFQKLKKDPSSVVGQRFGSVPILEHDGMFFAQSQAISQYAADLGINANVTPLQRAIDMQILGAHADVQTAMYKCLFGNDDSKKAGSELLGAVVDKFFAAFERIYPDSGYLHGGDAPSLGDLAIFDLVTSPFPGVLALKQDISKHSKIVALIELVKTHQPLQEYLKSLSSK